MRFILEKDIRQIYLIMSDPDIWDRITEDGVSLAKFYPPSDIYYTGIDKEIIGIARFERVNSSLFKYHPMILKQHRAKYSSKFHDQAIDLLRESFGNVSVIAEVPEIYKDVLFSAVRQGWNKVGKIKNGILKKGELIDIIILQYGK